MKRTKNADFWVNDCYLEQGLEKLLAESIREPEHLRFVIFTIDNYFAVKDQNYNYTTHRFILLITDYKYSFLSDFNMLRLDTRTNLNTMRNLILKTTWDLETTSKTPSKVMLTERDKRLLNQLSTGISVNEIASLNKIHFKTVYQIRQGLISKLGCTSSVDFFMTLRSDVFKTWILSA